MKLHVKSYLEIQSLFQNKQFENARMKTQNFLRIMIEKIYLTSIKLIFFVCMFFSCLIKP